LIFGRHHDHDMRGMNIKIQFSNAPRRTSWNNNNNKEGRKIKDLFYISIT